MIKLSANPPCFIVRFSELVNCKRTFKRARKTYGATSWGVKDQLKRNRQAVKLFSAWRNKEAVKLYGTRANQWALRAQASEDPRDYDRAAFAYRKIVKLKEAIKNAD